MTNIYTQIRMYSSKRVCLSKDCRRKLSIYNPNNHCHVCVKKLRHIDNTQKVLRRMDYGSVR